MLRSALPAAAVGLAAFLVSSVLAVAPGAGRLTPLGLYAPARALALGETPDALAISLAANVALLVGALVLAWLAFRGQELGG
jgi:hypothetical protein